MMGGSFPSIAEIGYLVSIWALPLLFAITLHEAAHGFVANKLGDDTAKVLGRVSFNPLRHVDPVGTVVLPALLLFMGGFLFGWAKPVPVDFGRLRHPRRDMVFVALAGPMTNLVLAVLSAFGILLAVEVAGNDGVLAQWLGMNFFNSIQINFILMLFNMIPLPPLDGGRVAVGLLPRGPARKLASLEGAGIFILLGLIFLLPMLGRPFGIEINLFYWLIGMPVEFLTATLLHLVGVA